MPRLMDASLLDLIGAYEDDIGKLRQQEGITLLSRAQERKLGKRVQAGDAIAREEMIKANLALVIYTARNWQDRGVDLEDLIGEGNIGLIRAVEKFNPRRGWRFATYATWWIRQSIWRAIKAHGHTIRIPAYLIELLAKWRKATRFLGATLGRTPTEAEVSKHLGLTRAKLGHVRRAQQLLIVATISAGDEVDEEGGDAWQFVDRQPQPDDEAARRDENNWLDSLLETLYPRAREVIDARFGLHDQDEQTLDDLGRKLKVTKERVRQIEDEALNSLRNRATFGQDFLAILRDEASAQTADQLNGSSVAANGVAHLAMPEARNGNGVVLPADPSLEYMAPRSRTTGDLLNLSNCDPIYSTAQREFGRAMNERYRSLGRPLTVHEILSTAASIGWRRAPRKGGRRKAKRWPPAAQELAKALKRHKKRHRHHRPFLYWSDVLEVLWCLGYEYVAQRKKAAKR